VSDFVAIKKMQGISAGFDQNQAGNRQQLGAFAG
jgi:hypothetical protein